jgi:hypothetical protein
MKNVFSPLSLFDMLLEIGGGLRTWCSSCGSPSWVVSFVFLDVSPLFCSLFFPFLDALVNIWLAGFHQSVLPFYVSKRAINYPYLMWWCKMVCLFLPFSPFNIPRPPHHQDPTTHAKHNWIGCGHCWLVLGQSLRTELSRSTWTWNWPKTESGSSTWAWSQP